MPTTDRDIAQLMSLAGSRPRLPEDRALRIRAAVLPAWLAETRSRRRRRVGSAALMALAAALIAAAGLSVWRSSPVDGPRVATAERIEGPPPTVIGPDGSSMRLSEGFVVQAGHRIASGEGRVALRLESGASLRIDTASELRMSSADLIELERGAIYVDSGSAPSVAAGISVETPLGKVEEIGTRFEVRFDDDGLRVRVRDGAVRLDGPGVSARGAAADELRLGPDGRVRRGSIATHGADWDWTLAVAPAFDLDGRTLGTFLRWTVRETGWTVRFADESLRTELESTLIRGPRASASPREALPLVLAACELSFRLEGGVVTIFNPRELGGAE